MKWKKTILSFGTAFALLGFLAGCGSDSDSEAKGEGTVKLKVATYVATSSPVYKYLTEPWMERVEELTEGQVTFDTYPAEQLGKAHDLLQLTKDKVTDIGIFPANYFHDQMPLTNVLAGFPDLSRNSTQGTLAYNDLINENEQLLETDYLKNGVRPLMTNVSPAYEIWTTKKEIRKPEDLKGLKIRTPGGVANEVYEQLGAVPVSVSHPETYEALEKGVIEAASYSSVAVDASGTIELLNHAMFPHLGTAIHAIVINESVWKGLPKNIQEAMTEAGQELVKQSGEKYDADTEAFNEKFAENGTIIELSAEEHKEWAEVYNAFRKKWMKEHESDGHPYEEVLKEYERNLGKYE